MQQKMSVKCCTFAAVGAIILVLSSMPEHSSAARITVGDSQNWHFGFNYSDWALKTAPFYLNDTLVFKYDPPNSTTFAHSVYLLKNLRSYRACNLKKATVVGNVMQGAGEGLEFVLTKRKPYYFACGERAGFHCNLGLMKFTVVPKRPCQG